MSDIHKKLENYLNESENSSDFLPEEDVNLMGRMLDFIMSLDSQNLSEDEIDEMTEIIDNIADENINEIFDEDEDDVDEAVSAKKVKIKPSDKRKRRMEYRRNRAAIKLRAKKFRRTTKYKQWTRMKKRKASSGKTARGKRIRKFL
jgi:hypothetical protein